MSAQTGPDPNQDHVPRKTIHLETKIPKRLHADPNVKGKFVENLVPCGSALGPGQGKIADPQTT